MVVVAFAELVALIVVYLAGFIQALWPQPPLPNMSIPVQESLHQCGNYTFNELVVVGYQRPNVHSAMVVPSQNGYLHNLIQSLLSILLCYVTIYLLAYMEQMPEDVPPVQEPIQCTNIGNAVTVIRDKDYPPPPD